MRCAIGRVTLQIEAMDAGVGMVAQLGFSKRLTPLQEDNMVGQPPILFFSEIFLRPHIALRIEFDLVTNFITAIL